MSAYFHSYLCGREAAEWLIFMKNVEIRAAFMAHGIKQWELAKKLGLSETHFSRKLRYELPPEEKERILSAIEKMAEEMSRQTATGV